MPDGWLRYYWALAKEFGAECLHISRADMLASALTVLFIFLIDQNTINLRTAIVASICTLVVIGILHSFRIPWLVLKRMQTKEAPLGAGWGILGITFFSAFIGIIGYGAAWFYTMQPKVIIPPIPFTIKSVDVVALEQCKSQLTHLTSPEPNDSLRRRTLKLADEYFQFVRKRYDNHPPYGNTNDKEPSEETKKMLAVDKQYDQETADQYNRLYRDRFVGIIREYQHKGVPVSWLEASAQNGNLMWILPGGSWEGSLSDQLTAFRNFAYRVDAGDQLIVLTY